MCDLLALLLEIWMRVVKVVLVKLDAILLHVQSPVVSNIEHLRIESQPLEEPLQLLGNIRFASRRHCITNQVHPTIPMMIFLGSA